MWSIPRTRPPGSSDIDERDEVTGLYQRHRTGRRKRGHRVAGSRACRHRAGQRAVGVQCDHAVSTPPDCGSIRSATRAGFTLHSDRVFAKFRQLRIKRRADCFMRHDRIAQLFDCMTERIVADVVKQRCRDSRARAVVSDIRSTPAAGARACIRCMTPMECSSLECRAPGQTRETKPSC